MESKRNLDIKTVIQIEKEANELSVQKKDTKSYLDSIKTTTKSDNLQFYLRILSVKFDTSISENVKLEKFKALVKSSFLETSDPFNKFKIRKEIASILLQSPNIYSGITHMLIGIGEIEKEAEKSLEHKNLILNAYTEIVHTKPLNIREKEYYTKILINYVHNSYFSVRYGKYYNLGYYNFENNEIDSAIHYFKKSINYKPDVDYIDADKIPDLLEKQKNFSWAHSYPYLIDCYSHEPDSVYKYIAKIDELYENNEVSKSTIYEFKIHILSTLVSIGEYTIAHQYIDELLAYYRNNCTDAYYMTIIFEHKSRMYKILNQKQNHIKALNKWFEYSFCNRSHEYFERQKLKVLDQLIEVHRANNNESLTSYYQSIKIKIHTAKLSKIANQREQSKVWFAFESEVEKSEGKYRSLVHKFQQKRFFLLAGITSIIAGLLIFILFLNRSLKAGEVEIVKKQNMLDETNKTLEKSNSLISYQNDYLKLQKNQIEGKHKENMLFVNFLSSEIENIVEDVKSIESENDVSLYKLKNRIERIVSKEMIDDIDLEFQERHKEFVQKLCHYHPNLTSSNIRLCILLKLNMNPKEIADIEGKTTESIKVAKSRLRKKLMININDITLPEYLNNELYDKV